LCFWLAGGLRGSRSGVTLVGDACVPQSLLCFRTQGGFVSDFSAEAPSNHCARLFGGGVVCATVSQRLPLPAPLERVFPRRSMWVAEGLLGRVARRARRLHRGRRRERAEVPALACSIVVGRTCSGLAIVAAAAGD
jgi:hypothetical protein